MGYGGDPANNANDAVRLLIGDTDTTDEQLSDPEVAYFLSVNPNKLLAASLAADSLAGYYSRQIDSEVDEIRALASQRKKHYTELAVTLRERARSESSGSLAITPSAIFAGGLSIAGKRTERDDTDRVPARFRRGMHDNSPDPDYRDGAADVANFGSD